MISVRGAAPTVLRSCWWSVGRGSVCRSCAGWCGVRLGSCRRERKVKGVGSGQAINCDTAIKCKRDKISRQEDTVRRGVARDPRELDYTGDSRIAKILPVYKKGGRTDRDGMRDGSGNVAEVVSPFYRALN
ncbi:hypothetical protein ANTRET_LOCUS9085 [Anthophora retusa]